MNTACYFVLSVVEEASNKLGGEEGCFTVVETALEEPYVRLEQLSMRQNQTICGHWQQLQAHRHCLRGAYLPIQAHCGS